MIDKLKKNYFLLIVTFLIIYFFFNLLEGNRGLISYFEKKNMAKQLSKAELILKSELNEYENKNRLLSKNLDLDFLDQLYREKLMLGTKDEILIKLK